MNSYHQNPHSVLWPLAILLFLTVGVFFTTREIPQQQDVRSRAQVDQPEGTQPGPIINLAFSVPGISSQGGNLEPLHQTRNLNVRFYDPDSNTFDKTTKPLYEIKTKAFYDKDPTSPTYTSFVTADLALGTVVPEGEYQLVLKTDQATQTLIKEKSSDIGGKIFSLHSDSVLFLPSQAVIVGDIAPLPDGDNTIDIADYNAFIACFDTRASTSSCTAKQLADFDDNGVVDGIDYNLLFISLKSLSALGLLVPTISPTPSLATTPTPTPLAVASSSSVNGSILSVSILVLIFSILLGGAFYFLLKAKAKTLESKEYYIKKQSADDSGVWLTLTDDNGPKLGHYKEKDVKEGFARIKGVTKKENGKIFIEITEIIWEKS